MHGAWLNGVVALHGRCRMLLEGELFMNFFEKVDVANFEVASDAFSTFKVRNDVCAPASCVPASAQRAELTFESCDFCIGPAHAAQGRGGPILARTLHRGTRGLHQRTRGSCLLFATYQNVVPSCRSFSAPT
jgi:hypothetical protein